LGGKSGADDVFPGFPGFRQGTVSDLQTGIVQTTNYDLDFPCIGLIDAGTACGAVSENARSGQETVSR
jgi:hypothetical protein